MLEPLKSECFCSLSEVPVLLLRKKASPIFLGSQKMKEKIVFIFNARTSWRGRKISPPPNSTDFSLHNLEEGAPGCSSSFSFIDSVLLRENRLAEVGGKGSLRPGCDSTVSTLDFYNSTPNSTFPQLCTPSHTKTPTQLKVSTLTAHLPS